MSEKAVCTKEAYGRIMAVAGLDKLRLLSCYTYIDDPGFTPMGPGTHIYTEWGDADGDFLCEHEEHNGEHTYRTRPELVTATAIDAALTPAASAGEE